MIASTLLLLWVMVGVVVVVFVVPVVVGNVGRAESATW